MSDFLELRRVMDAVLKRWWFIVVMIAVSAAMGYSITKKQTPVYQATTTVLVGQGIELAQLDRVDIQTSEALVQTYVEMAQREPVLEGVVKTLELNKTWQDLRKQVEVQPVAGTQLIEIVVESDSPDTARRIADEVANQLLLISPKSSTDNNGSDPVENFNREQLISLQERILNGQKRLAALEIAIESASSAIELAALQNEKTTLEGLIVDWERNYAALLPFTSAGPNKEPNRLTVIETAYSNNTQVRPNVNLNTLLGGALGIVLALGIIFLFDFLDETYKSADDLSQSEGLEILGSVGRIAGRKYSDKIITRLAPFSSLAESYRIIRNRLRLETGVVSKRSIMITSAIPQEGKSLTVANLGIILAEANIKTVIVDADLRGSALHLAFDLKSENGLADALRQPGSRIEDYLKTTPVANLHILTSGKVPSNASELLGSGSRGMLKIINDLKQFADVVILDSPPASVSSDAISLSNQVDDVILVVRAGKSKKSDLKKTLYNLQNNRADFLGCIFNFSPTENTYLSKRADYFKPRRVSSSSTSNGSKPEIAREEVNKADFDYLMMHTDKNSQSSVLEHAVHVPVAEASAEIANMEVVHFNETEDSSISADSILESPAVEDASVSEVQMSEPRELTPKANGNVELAFSETQSGETRTKSQSHARTLKRAVSNPKTDEHQSAEDASDH
jgi:non-specific protein-tyrosine kinase